MGLLRRILDQPWPLLLSCLAFYFLLQDLMVTSLPLLLLQLMVVLTQSTSSVPVLTVKSVMQVIPPLPFP